MTEALGAEKGEQTARRQGSRSGCYRRRLVNRVGKIEPQVAIGMDWEERRQVLAVELANRVNETSWKEFLLGLKERGCTGCNWWSATTMRG